MSERPAPATVDELRAELLQLQIAQLKRPEPKSGALAGLWHSPLLLAIIGGAVTLLAAIISNWSQLRAARELERQKLASNVLLKAIETGDPLKAAQNLAFFAKLGVIDIPQDQVDSFLKKPETAPVLPNAAAPARVRSNAERQQLFGRYEWVPDPDAGPGAIRILDNWVEENIRDVEVPQLKGKAGTSGRVKFHKAGVEQLKAAFAEIEAHGLLDRILSWDGSFVPRTVRGSTTMLSNHAFGNSFDINAQWNPAGQAPVPVGARGSVLELVPIFEKHGFVWGGTFPRPEAHHFELGRAASD